MSSCLAVFLVKRLHLQIIHVSNNEVGVQVLFHKTSYCAVDGPRLCRRDIKTYLAAELTWSLGRCMNLEDLSMCHKPRRLTQPAHTQLPMNNTEKQPGRLNPHMTSTCGEKSLTGFLCLVIIVQLLCGRGVWL